MRVYWFKKIGSFSIFCANMNKIGAAQTSLKNILDDEQIKKFKASTDEIKKIIKI